MKFVLIALSAAAAFAGEAEALAISAGIQARHLPWGTVVDPFYASPTSEQITGYTRCGDSAIWTGHYLAAEAFRYRVTGSGDALRNARNAIAALNGLVDVTGNGSLARCRVLASSPFAPGIRSEEASNEPAINGEWLWFGNISRDQYCGVTFGLGVAFDMIGDPEVRESIRAVTTKLVAHLVSNDFSQPIFATRPDQVLAILQVAAHVDPARFASEYAARRDRLASSVALPVAFDSLSNNSYFKYNLIHINFYHLIGLEDTAVKSTYQSALRPARNATAAHQNAFFNMVDRALNGPNAQRDAETIALLDLWLKRPTRDFYVDLTTKIPVCSGAACTPIPVDLRTPTDFLWQRSPFQLAGGGAGTIGNPGVDYILPYWMARYYGVIGDFTVYPAAAPATAVASDSLVSLYGSGLAGAGRVIVTDASGVERAGTLTYVGPNQINFLMPSGVPDGSALVTVYGTGVPAGSRVQSASVNIQRVAPAVFSFNASGSGPAAATAVRVGVDGVQTPLPLDAPLELRELEPVYVNLYATGLRHRSQLSRVNVTINGTAVPVLYAGPQPEFPGLDQVNIQLPFSLRGSGEAAVLVTVDDVPANAVTLSIR